MCGRYLLNVDVEEILQHYGIVKGWFVNNRTPDWTPEIFPSNTVPVVINRNVKELIPMKWGFAAPNGKGLIINSRGETVDSRPMFRRAFRQKRCLIPANAFFEWRRAGKTATKFQIRMKQLSLFSLAGLYEGFTDKEGQPYHAFSILTTTPNPLVAQIHDRMPVILPKEREDTWLNAGLQDISLLKTLIRSYDEEEMTMEEI
jgi:putative SOS response-associated peptidase YedK